MPGCRYHLKSVWVRVSCILNMFCRRKLPPARLLNTLSLVHFFLSQTMKILFNAAYFYFKRIRHSCLPQDGGSGRANNVISQLMQSSQALLITYPALIMILQDPDHIELSRKQQQQESNHTAFVVSHMTYSRSLDWSRHGFVEVMVLFMLQESHNFNYIFDLCSKHYGSIMIKIQSLFNL